MSVKIEVFTSPTCSSCKQAKTVVNEVMESLGTETFDYREVDITEDMDYATRLGVRATPSIAIDGEVRFTGVPREPDLTSALKERL